MECVQAQQVISAALDREPVDAYQLEEAKDHCRTCPECGVFVRAQLVATQVPLPEPSADLADRVMARIRAEAAADEAAAVAQAEAARDKAAAAQAEPAPPSPTSPIATLAPKPRTAHGLPRIWVSAGAAAAVLVALVGTLTVVVFGMKQMTGTPVTKSTVYRNSESAAQAPNVSADLSTGGAFKAAPTAPSTEATGGQSITINGVVYRLAGPAKVDTSTSTIVGSTTTALGGGDSLRRRDAWAGATADTVYLADDKGGVFAFTRQTRTYAGLTFVLTSAELSSFAEWPTLPTQITPPTSADGAPTFTFDGTDAAGVRVYRLTNSSATQGIAIAPNAPASDPAAGNPNWTWWAISH